MKVVKLEEKQKQKKELYTMLTTLPKPPVQFKLSASQKYWWRWIGVTLVKTNNVAELDLLHLQRAAYWLDVRCRMIHIQNVKQKHATPGTAPGLIQTFSSGAQQTSVYTQLIEKADKALGEISSHFGLSIRDRNKLAAPPEVDPAQTDLFNEFLNQKTM